MKPLAFEATAEQISLLFMAHSRQVRDLKSDDMDQIREGGERKAHVVCSDGTDMTAFWF